jgi:hypothetical protein
MMHVCLHDSFSVNYACDFVVHQIGRSRSSTQRNTRDNRPVSTQNRIDAHSPLATGECCDIYESERSRSARSGNAQADDHEPAVVKHPLLCTTLWCFLLLLLFDFGSL